MVKSQGKVSERSGNFEMDIEWQPCILRRTAIRSTRSPNCYCAHFENFKQHLQKPYDGLNQNLVGTLRFRNAKIVPIL